MMENATLDIKNRSHTITADVEVPREAARASSSRKVAASRGWSLYMKDGKAQVLLQLV